MLEGDSIIDIAVCWRLTWLMIEWRSTWLMLKMKPYACLHLSLRYVASTLI